MVKRTTTARPYPSDESLVRAAVELARAYPDAQERVLRGLALARKGGVADTSQAPQDQALVTRINGHLLVYAPGTPYAWTCTCPDYHHGASTRELAPGTPYEPTNRWCKHAWALRVVADAAAWEARPVALRRPRAVLLLDVDPQSLRLVA